MRFLAAMACLVAACVSAPALAGDAVTTHSREIAQIQQKFAPLVRLQGRELVVYDADGLVRAFGDAVMGRTWDKVPRGARGSFERIAEATGERRAFSMLVRVGGKVECRVGPTSPDQSWMNLLAAYSGYERTTLNRRRMKLTSAIFQRFVLLHEVGHCIHRHAFDHDKDPFKNLWLRHRAEAFGDTFAILQLGREGVEPAVLAEIAQVRSLYMSASSLGSDAAKKAGGISDAAVAGLEHVAYWNIGAMKSAAAVAAQARRLDDAGLVALAQIIVDQDGVTPQILVGVHRALAKESGFTNPEAEIAAAEADHALVRSEGAAPVGEPFDKDAWEKDFLGRLKQAGAGGGGPASAIAAERERLRARAATEDAVASAGAIEEALGRLAELAMKGYAGITDPPVTVSSTGNSTNRIPVAAMPARVENVGPVPSQALKGALEAATARPVAAKATVTAARTSLGTLPMAAPRQAVVPVRQPAFQATLQPAGRLPSAPVGKVVKGEPLQTAADEMTGMSPAMMKVRAEVAAAARMTAKRR